MSNNKVTIEITPENYEIKIELNGKTHVQKGIRTNVGTRITEGDLEENEEIPDVLYDSLDSFFCHGVLGALNKI